MNMSDFLYLFGVRKRVLPSFFGLAAFALIGCSSSTETAGGGPSGTEAGNAITAQIMVAGKPAAYARVKLTESESLDASKTEFIEAD